MNTPKNLQTYAGTVVEGCLYQTPRSAAVANLFGWATAGGHNDLSFAVEYLRDNSQADVLGEMANVGWVAHTLHVSSYADIRDQTIDDLLAEQRYQHEERP